MAASCLRMMACAWLPRSQLLCRCVFAALSLSIGAVRLERDAFSSDGSTAAGLASRASVPLAEDSAAVWAQRDRDLRDAASYIDSVGVQDYLHLGNIRDRLEHLEDIKARVTSFGAARDSLHRLQVRKILRDAKTQSETLHVMASTLEAEGEMDDGGDELPTQRDNICSRISKYPVQVLFIDMVQLLCDLLDAVRKAVNAGEDEEQMAYSVSGLFFSLGTKSDYQHRNIAREIEQVLGEERRWVARHLAQWSAGIGNASNSPEATKTRFRRWALRSWQAQIWTDDEEDSVESPFRALKKAKDTLESATVEDDLILSSVRARIKRLQFCRFGLANFISCSDAAFRERLRDVFQEIKARMDALDALAARKSAAGEVDNSDELLPSQRDNICTKLQAFGLAGDFREDVRKLCETLDRVRASADIELETETDKGVFEVLGRALAIRRRPGYADTPVAVELESLLAEESMWLTQRAASVGA